MVDGPPEVLSIIHDVADVTDPQRAMRLAHVIWRHRQHDLRRATRSHAEGIVTEELRRRT